MSNIFNTDIDPGCAFIDASPGETSIDVSSGPGFRKPGPGSSHDSGYVGLATVHRTSARQ